MDRKDSDLEEKDDFLFEIKKLVMPKGAENRFFVTLFFLKNVLSISSIGAPCLYKCIDPIY